MGSTFDNSGHSTVVGSATISGGPKTAGGGGGTNRRFGLTPTQRDRLQFAYRTTGDEVLATRADNWPVKYTPTDGDRIMMYDMTGNLAQFNTNDLAAWDGTEEALTTEGVSGLTVNGVKEHWNQYVDPRPFAILMRFQLLTLPSNTGNSFNPILQSRSGGRGVSWNLRNDDQTIRFRVKNGNGTDILDTYDWTMSKTFDTTSYHDFIATGDGSVVDMWYDDTKVNTHSYVGTGGDKSLDQPTDFFNDRGSRKVPVLCEAVLFDDMYWDSNMVANARNWGTGGDF